MIIYRLLSVRQVLWRIFHVHTRPNLPLAERLVMRGLVSWVIASSYIQWWTRTFFSLTHTFKLLIFMSVDFIVCLDHSCYTQGRIGRVSASWSKDRGFDHEFNSKIFFPQKMSEIIFSIMVPIGNSHVLSESLWFDIMAGSYILLICSFVSRMGL